MITEGLDMLSVVDRAHHHTLWTRIPDYKTAYLDDLVKERKVFEHWFHAVSYLSMKDFRFALAKMLEKKMVHNTTMQTKRLCSL